MYHQIMSGTPFWDKTRQLAQSMDYTAMQVYSDNALSHGWWRRMAQHGPWGEAPGTGRVNPPSPERLEGIAKLFGTTEQRVAEMIAEDWYEVHAGFDVSARVLNLSHLIDGLSDEDAEYVESLVRRLSRPVRRTVAVTAGS
jgi:hypothetical protein